MATFTGTNADETITPAFVSLTVVAVGSAVPGAGVDFVDAGAGDDLVRTGSGNDSVALGAGNDLFLWQPGDGSDTVEGGADFDTVDFDGSAGAEAFVLSANGARAGLARNVGNIVMDLFGVERLEIDALGGADTVTVNNLAATHLKQVIIDLETTLDSGLGDGQQDQLTVNASGAGDVMTFTGSGGVAFLAGLAASVVIQHAENAFDTLKVNGLGGNDVINAAGMPTGILRVSYDGGAGNDTLIAGDNAEALLGGSGVDTASFAASPVGVAVSLGGGLGAGGYATNDNFVGIENLTGSVSADTLTGNGQANVLRGLGSSDILSGAGGGDMLVGGFGADTMNGGAGADVFDFNLIGESGLGVNRDTIVGFSHAQHDRINLVTIDANQTAGHAGNQAFVFIGAQTFAAHVGSGEIRNGPGGVIQINVDADNAAEMEIRVGLALVAGDFVL